MYKMKKRYKMLMQAALCVLLLCLALVLPIFAGCDQPSDEPHIPTGDALVMEGQDPDSVGPQEEEIPQELSLVYYPNRSLNPLTCTDYTNRVLFSLMYPHPVLKETEYLLNFVQNALLCLLQHH